jgi:hypothetical protein
VVNPPSSFPLTADTAKPASSRALSSRRKRYARWPTPAADLLRTRRDMPHRTSGTRR